MQNGFTVDSNQGQVHLLQAVCLENNTNHARCQLILLVIQFQFKCFFAIQMNSHSNLTWAKSDFSHQYEMLSRLDLEVYTCLCLW